MFLSGSQLAPLSEHNKSLVVTQQMSSGLLSVDQFNLPQTELGLRPSLGRKYRLRAKGRGMWRGEGEGEKGLSRDLVKP